MSVPLPRYKVIKDQCCLCYYGNSAEIVSEMKAARPLIERELPGLNIYLSVQPHLSYLVEEYGRTIPMDQMKDRKRDFGYIKELKYSMEDRESPVVALLRESGIS